ncbi:hypothetical protein SUGI_0181600 [Cryptomeria japonica]|nr:hypothetical protein SUGI_0181600 [Cryptomeria japonica]
MDFSSSLLIVAFLVVCLGGLKLHVMRKITLHIMVLEGLKAFSYKETEAATSSFREELGRGFFGKVCKGCLDDGRAIVVKILDDKVVQEKHGGACLGSHRLLVYEYMGNGSLDIALFVDSEFLDWRTQIKMSMGTIRGILYLNKECRTQTIHCDIKPQNILLDQNYNPKLSDFGLVKLLMAERTATRMAARGTRGYIVPKWMNNTSITIKVDIYSFRVMLLDIICCKKTMELDAPKDEIFLDQWVYGCFKHGELAKLVEQQQVEGEGALRRQLERMVLVGLWCIQEDPYLRPSTKKVVQMMEGIVEIAVPTRPRSFVGLLCV